MLQFQPGTQGLHQLFEDRAPIDVSESAVSDYLLNPFLHFCQALIRGPGLGVAIHSASIGTAGLPLSTARSAPPRWGPCVNKFRLCAIPAGVRSSAEDRLRHLVGTRNGIQAAVYGDGQVHAELH